jgi:hypothetical protein
VDAERRGIVAGQRAGSRRTAGPCWPWPARIDPNNGFISQAASHRAVLDWLHFRLPWWNPSEGTGTPLAGGMQSAAVAYVLTPAGQTLPESPSTFTLVFRSPSTGITASLERLRTSRRPTGPAA